MEDVLKSNYNASPLEYDNLDWFVNEVMKLQNKMPLCFKNNKKDIIMTKEDVEDYTNKNTCQFCEKEISIGKVRDHCHLTGKYTGQSHNACNKNVTKQQSNNISFIFQSFISYECQMFFER